MVSWRQIQLLYTSSVTGIVKSTTINRNSFKLEWTQSFAETTEFSPTVHWEGCMKKWSRFNTRYSSDIQPEQQKLAKLSWYLVYQLKAAEYPLSNYHIDIHQTWPMAFNVQHLDVRTCKDSVYTGEIYYLNVCWWSTTPRRTIEWYPSSFK